VIHHSPNTQACVDEIYRVLKNGGTASVSVYYKNIILKSISLSIVLINFLGKYFIKNMGRGRDLSNVKNINDLVRLYDGSQNPIGKAYSKKEFELMLIQAGFVNIEINYFFFPFRFMKFKIPNFLRLIIVYLFPFMIVANLTK